MARPDFTKSWKILHGSDLPAAVARLAPDAATENANWRKASFLDQPNVFVAAVLDSHDSHHLPLWEPFANLVPIESLGNGDMLFVHAPLQPGPAPVVVWNHETDRIEEPTADDLGSLPRADPGGPIRFATRSLYIVRLLARGRFELDEFLAFGHGPFTMDDNFLGNVKKYPPTALYAMWHLFFQKDEKSLKRVLDAAGASPARFIKDSAALVRELLDGRKDLGEVKDLHKLRDEIAPIITNPKTLEQAVARQRRAMIDRRLAGAPGPVRLVPTKAAAVKPAARIRESKIGDAVLVIKETKKPPRTCLVLTRDGRSLAATDLIAPGALPIPRSSEPGFVRAGKAAVAVWRTSDPKANTFPHDGSVTFYTVVKDRIVPFTGFDLDVAHIDEKGVVRTLDGAGYEVEGLDSKPPVPEAIPPIPGRKSKPPAQAAPAEIDGVRFELTPTALKAWREKKLLWEEPFIEAYSMAVLPARRMIAIHAVGHDFRPVVDIYYVHVTDKPARLGDGACSWVCWPVDGRDIVLKSSADALYVDEGDGWREVDSKPLTDVPSWIKARKWL